MKYLILKLINIYQALPLNTHSQCRFYPTCSNYMKEAITKYGLLIGLKLGIKRLFKCHPYGKYGYDPVPILNNKNN